MATMGPNSSRAADEGGVERAACPRAMWRSTFSTITIASSTTRPDREHDREEREEVHGEAEQEHQEDTRRRARSGIATTGMSTVRNEPMKRKMTATTMQQRLGEGLEHLVEGVLDVGRRVVGDPALMPAGSSASIPFISRRTSRHHLERVRRGQDPECP